VAELKELRKLGIRAQRDMISYLDERIKRSRSPPFRQKPKVGSGWIEAFAKKAKPSARKRNLQRREMPEMLKRGT
jgi:hypothetical protein